MVEPGAMRDEIVFEVRDTGIGIAPEQQARIFLEFEQAEGGADRKFSGTGLGLAISRRIVERMGGRIGVASGPGQGSTFRVALTLPRLEDAGAPGFAAPALGGKAMLIAAPVSLGASLLARRLTRWGATVQRVDANNIADVIAGQHFDVMLVDHGADAAAAVLLTAGATIARRIVLITPSGRHSLPALKAAGCTGYLVKPVRAASLAARLAGDAPFDEAAEAPVLAAGGRRAGLPGQETSLLARALLGKLGHRPTMVTNGAAAVAAWRARAGRRRAL